MALFCNFCSDHVECILSQAGATQLIQDPFCISILFMVKMVSGFLKLDSYIRIKWPGLDQFDIKHLATKLIIIHFVRK